MSRTRYLLVLPAALSGALACEGFVLNPHGEDPSANGTTAEQPAGEAAGPVPTGHAPGNGQGPDLSPDDDRDVDPAVDPNPPPPGGDDADAGAPPSRTKTAADAGALALPDAAIQKDAQ